MDSLTCIDIGNQNTKFATFSQTGEIIEKGSEPNSNAASTLRSLSQNSRLFISDVGNVSTKINLGSSASLLTLNHKFPFSIDYKTPHTLGQDRLCGLSGALYHEPEKSCLVFNMGTCLTIDFLGKDKVYKGGNISPGLSLRYKTLHHFTANLPMISHRNTEQITGTDTETAILCGVQNGFLAELEFYINHFSALPDKPRIFLTGGDTVYFENRLKSKIFAAPLLNLYGLFNIAKLNGII